MKAMSSGLSRCEDNVYVWLFSADVVETGVSGYFGTSIHDARETLSKTVSAKKSSKTNGQESISVVFFF